MAELTLKLEVDPVTGKKNISIDLKSDADALPVEHEEHHKQLVNKLFNGKIKASRQEENSGEVTADSQVQEKSAEAASS